MDRITRHVQQLPTKSVFTTFASLSGGSTLTNVGGFAGVLINANNEATYISFQIPHDFRKLLDLKLIVIPRVSLAAMTIRVVCNFTQPGVVYTQHTKTLDRTWLAVLDAVQEISIEDVLDTLIAPLDKEAYVGIQIIRVAGQNTNAMVIGLKMRYI